MLMNFCRQHCSEAPAVWLCALNMPRSNFALETHTPLYNC